MEPTTARPHRIAELATRNNERNKQKSPGRRGGRRTWTPLAPQAGGGSASTSSPHLRRRLGVRACSRPNGRNQSGPHSLHPAPRHGAIPAWIIATCMRWERIWGTKPRIVGSERWRGSPFFSYKFYGGWNVRTKIVRETILTTFRENWEKYHLCALNSDSAETSWLGRTLAYVGRRGVVGRKAPDDRRPTVPPRGSPVSSL